ncbi:MAG: hypothetical protein ACW98Y_05970 [Candidatus Thorarchaeota archaeon]|jgi:hypothetical protein
MVKRRKTILFLLLVCTLVATGFSLLSFASEVSGGEVTALQGKTGTRPTDRTAPPDRTRTTEFPYDPGSAYTNIAFTIPTEWIVVGTILLVVGIVGVFLIRNSDSEFEIDSRSNILKQIYSLDDEIDEDAGEEGVIKGPTPDQRIIDEAIELAPHREWDCLLEALEVYLVEQCIHDANMTSLVKVLLPLRDKHQISLSRRKISKAIMILVKFQLLKKSKGGEIALSEIYENRVQVFLSGIKMIDSNYENQLHD